MGNEQLLALYNQRKELGNNINAWKGLSKRIGKREPNWDILKRLMDHASALPDSNAILAQVNTIERQRQLLEDPDPVTPLIANLTQLLRDELNKLDEEYSDLHEVGLKRMEDDSNWQQLKPDQRYQLLSAQKLHKSARPKVKVQSTDDVLETLDHCSLSVFSDRVAALPGRFGNVAIAAAKLCEPKIQFVNVPRRTLKTAKEIDAWAEEAKSQLKAALSKGPVSIR